MLHDRLNNLLRDIVDRDLHLYPQRRRSNLFIHEQYNPKNNRKMCEKDYMTDDFGKRLPTTISNLVTMILFLIIMLMPFALVGWAIFINHNPNVIHFAKYVVKFFSGWLIFFLILIPILTIINNHRIHNVYHKQITYSPKRLKLRKRWLKNYYQKKFGTYRQSKKSYVVAKNNNIPIDYIIKHYRKLKEGVID